MASARKPMASDSPSAITPRITGRRKNRCRFITELIELETCSISPWGVRTATDQFEGPRIITPSRTACPPMGLLMAGGRYSGAACAAGLLETALEALDTAARID